MSFDLKKIRDENEDIFGNRSLREVANSLFTHNDVARSMYNSVDDWAEKEGLQAEWAEDDALVEKQRRRAEQQAQIEQRGFFGQAASTLARGAYRGLEMIPAAASGVERISRRLEGKGEQPEDAPINRLQQSMQKFREDTPFLQAKESEGVAGMVKEGTESFATSMTTTLTGAAIGSAIPGIGTIMGAAIGFIAGAPLFGLADYDEKIEQGLNSERYKQGKFTREQLESAAIRSSIAEAGFELGSNVLDIVFLKGGAKLLTVGARKAAKESWRKMLTGGIKGSAKRMGMVMAAEVPSELATAAVQTQPHNLITGEEKSWFESAREALGPTVVASLLFGALGDAGYRSNIKSHEKILSNPLLPKDVRLNSLEAVGKQFDNAAPQYAEEWRKTAGQAVDQNLPVSEKLASDENLTTPSDDVVKAHDNPEHDDMDPVANEAYLGAVLNEGDIPEPTTTAPPVEDQVIPVDRQADPTKLKREEVETELSRMEKAQDKRLKDIERLKAEDKDPDARATMAVDYVNDAQRIETFKKHLAETEEVKEEPKAKERVEEPEKLPDEVSPLEGKYVSYKGDEGFLVKKKDGWHVVGADGDTFVEGGESGESIQKLGLKRMKRPTIKYDEETKEPQKTLITDKVGAYDPQKQQLTRPDGEQWTLTGFNRNKDGKVVSATFMTPKGEEKTMRSGIETFYRTQSIYNRVMEGKAPLRETPTSPLEGLDETQLPEDAAKGRSRTKEDRRIDKEIQEKYRDAKEEDITFDIFTAIAEDDWVNEATPAELEELNNIVGLPEGTNAKELKRFATRWLETNVPIMTETEKLEAIKTDLPDKLPPNVKINIPKPGQASEYVNAQDKAKEIHREVTAYDKLSQCLL